VYLVKPSIRQHSEGLSSGQWLRHTSGVPIRRPYQDHCALAAGLDIIGDRWTMLIVRDLLLGPLRFGELQANLLGIAPDVLSARLKMLIAAEVIEHRDTHHWLTAKGEALLPSLRALATWGAAELASEPSEGTLTARTLLTGLVLAGSTTSSSWTLALSIDDQHVVLSGSPAGVDIAGAGANVDGQVVGDVLGLYHLVHVRGHRTVSPRSVRGAVRVSGVPRRALEGLLR
jgi:DNA-binding HxlR family transcriptional regulator